MIDVLRIRELVRDVVRALVLFRPFQPGLVSSFVVTVAGTTDTTFTLPVGTWMFAWSTIAGSGNGKNAAIRFFDAPVVYPTSTTKRPMAGVVILPNIANVRRTRDMIENDTGNPITCHAVIDQVGNEAIRFVRLA